MKCIKCSVDLHTKYLGICEKCRTISWSPKYLNKNLRAIFLANEKEIREKYIANYNGMLVYGAEQNFGMYSIDDGYYYLKYPIKKGRYRFLNAGTIIGQAGDACEFYNKIQLKSSQTSDQMPVIRYISNHSCPNITVDQPHELFAVNGGRAGLESIDYQIKNNRLFATQTNNWPTILHVPGKFFIGLDSLKTMLKLPPSLFFKFI